MLKENTKNTNVEEISTNVEDAFMENKKSINSKKRRESEFLVKENMSYDANISQESKKQKTKEEPEFVKIDDNSKDISVENEEATEKGTNNMKNIKGKTKNKMLKEKTKNTNVEEISTNVEDAFMENKKSIKSKKRRESEFLVKENMSYDANISQEPKNKKAKKESEFVKNDDHSEDISVENEESTEKGTNNIPMNTQDGAFWKKFIRSLKEEKALEAVQYLLLDIKGRDIIAEYLEAGGSALRLVEVLDRAKDEKSTSLACTVFSAVRLTILKCMSKFPLKEISTEQTCKHILNSYGTTIYDILTNSVSFREKKIALSLLAAMATMSITLANEVLILFNTLSAKYTDKLAAHTNFGEDKSVRVYFLHLFLAFFSHGYSHLIKLLLGLRSIMRSVTKGLMYDDATTVVLILTALQDNIVDSDAMMKTVKIHTFNTPVLLDIVSLYKWKGPKSKKINQKNKIETEDDDENENNSSQANKKDQELVQECVHRILLQLLTNHKLGVIFQDPSVGTSGKRCNELAYSVLKIVEKEKYWRSDLVRQLTAKTLEACPDLVSPVLNLLVNSFEPTPSVIWLKTVQFLQEVINNINEEICQSTTLNIKQLANAVTSMVFNTPVCKVLATEDCLNHPHPTVRHQSIALLLCCFNKIIHLTSVVKQQYTDTPQDLNNFKNHIINFKIKNIKSMPQLVKAFQSGLDGEIYGIHAPTAIDYYMTLVDLFLVYNEIHSKTVKNEPDLINTLTNFKTTELFPENDYKVDLLNIKLTKLVYLLNPMQSSLTEFGEMIETLVHLLGKQPMARSVLQDILASSYLFNGNTWEVNVWVHCFQLESGNVSVVKLFLDILNRTVKNTFEIAQMLSGAKDIAVKNIKSENRDELDWDKFIKLSENAELEHSQNVKSLSYFSVSPLVPAMIIALEQSENSCKDLKDFVVNLFMNVLHAQASPEAFYSLIKDSKVKVMKTIKKYLSDWTKEQSLCSHSRIFERLVKILHLNTPEYKICKALYEPVSEESFTEITVDLDADRIILLLRLVIFHITQLIVKGGVEKDILERATTLVKNLLRSLASRCENIIPYVQNILLHPILIDKFQPLDNGSNNLTQIVLTMIRSCDMKNEKVNFLTPYKQRMIDGIKEALVGDKSETGFIPHQFNGTESMLEALEVLSVPAEEAQLILKNILGTQNNTSKIWLEMAAYLLVTISKSSLCLSPVVIKQLPEHPCLHHATALYLARFPHQISLIKTDVLVKEQKELSKLTELMLKFDNDGALLLKLLDNNRHNPKVVFPALVAASCRPRFKTSNYQVVHHHVKMIQKALKRNPQPSWITCHSAFIGTLIKDQKNLECHQKLRDYFMETWETLELTETLMDIAEPVFAKMEQQTTLVMKLLKTLGALTNPDTFNSCEKICNRIQKYVQTNQQKDWSCVSKSNEWKEWCKLALKYGEDPDLKAPFLLSTLSILCSAAYSSDSNMNLDNMLEMIFSHSQFLNAMIWKTPTKYELLQLILNLITLKPSLSHTNHVPIYLSAYNASLSDTDQIIIQLLQLYEKNGVGLSNWKPYLWGEAAIGYYSLRNKATPSLLHTAKSKEVFSLFNQKMVESTIVRFPIDRNLEVETMVESDKGVYDPAFFLPLFTEMLASNEIIKIRNVTESGALAITISALSSQNKLVRSAAYLVIARFYQHIVSQNNDSLCLQFVEALYKGVCSLNQHVPQLSTIITTFLARTQLVLTDSSHPMYKALGRFIIAKPEFIFTHIPEWSRLFRSTELEHKIHQVWILEILRDGLRQGKDIGLVISNNIITILMEYYSSVLSDKKTKFLILEVILSVFKASKYSEKNKSLCHTLAVQSGLSSWLSHTIYSPHLNPLLLTPLISLLSIINTHIRRPLLVLNLVLHLLTKFPSKVQIIDLLKIVDSLPASVLSLTVVNTLIQFMEANCSNTSTKQCHDILVFGTCYQRNVDEKDDGARYLKSIVIKYAKYHVEKQQVKKLVKNKSVKVNIKKVKNGRVVKRNTKDLKKKKTKLV